MIMDTLGFVHGTGASVQGPMSVASGVYGDVLTTAAYSALELDLGAPGSASSYPYVSQFPSYTEQGYTSPPTVVGVGGISIGLNIMITAAFTVGSGFTSGTIDVCSSATTAATYTGPVQIIATRILTLAQMAVIGAVYFIPLNPYQILEFNRFHWIPNGNTPGAGKVLAWYGPRNGGGI